MGIFTEIKEEKLADFLAKNYRLGHFYRSAGIQSGSQNTNYWLRTDMGEFVFTLFEGDQSVDDIEAVNAYTDFLNDYNIRVPRVMRSLDGARVTKMDGKPVILSRFIHGFGLNPRNISEQYCKTVGYSLAILHETAKSYDQKLSSFYDKKNWTSILAKAQQSENYPKGQYWLRIIEEDAPKLVSEWPSDVDMINIHGDLFPDNVLFIDDMLTGIIDFNFASYDNPIYDLSIALLAWSFDETNEFLLERFMTFVLAYAHESPFWLSRNYRHLPFFLKAAAMRFCLSRLHDFCMKRHRTDKAPLDPALMVDRYKFLRDNGDDLFSKILKEITRP